MTVQTPWADACPSGDRLAVPMSTRTTPAPSSRTRTIFAAAALAAGTAVTLSGCSLIEAAQAKDASYQFDTIAEARKSDDGVRFPGFIADGSRDVELFAKLDDFGAAARWTSENGITAEYCTPGPIEGKSAVEPAWWPTDVPETGWDCDRWMAFEKNGTYYAWDTASGDPEGD
jgi:hypothetical protein